MEECVDLGKAQTDKSMPASAGWSRSRGEDFLFGVARDALAAVACGPLALQKSALLCWAGDEVRKVFAFWYYSIFFFFFYWAAALFVAGQKDKRWFWQVGLEGKADDGRLEVPQLLIFSRDRHKTLLISCYYYFFGGTSLVIGFTCDLGIRHSRTSTRCFRARSIHVAKICVLFRPASRI